MNDLSLPDPFDFDPFMPSLRSLWRPMRVEGEHAAPRIRLDVRETDGAYTVKAEIPGVRKEDIDVRIEGNQVTIAAEVQGGKEEKEDGRVLRSERRYGYASRSFALGSAVDAETAQARYADGILELQLPKRGATEARKLAVA